MQARSSSTAARAFSSSSCQKSAAFANGAWTDWKKSPQSRAFRATARRSVPPSFHMQKKPSQPVFAKSSSWSGTGIPNWELVAMQSMFRRSSG